MKKIMLCIGFLIVSNVAYGAASSSQSGHEDERFIVNTMPQLEGSMVDLATKHLPTPVKCFVASVAKGFETSEFVLFYGPPGTAKTTSALAIGQRYYAGRTYGYKGSDLLGDQFQMSAKKALDVNLGPIIKLAAEGHPQYIVIDEFERFAKRRKSDSADRLAAITHFWSLVEDMRQTSNIVLVGTCNKLDGFPAPLADRFGELSRFEFSSPPVGLYRDVFCYYLGKLNMPHVISTAQDVNEVVSQFSCSVRKIDQILKASKRYALERSSEEPRVTKGDVIRAINELKRIQSSKTETWEKHLKKHERKTQAVSSYGGVALAAGGLCVSAGLAALNHYYRNKDQERSDRIRREDQEIADKRHNETLDVSNKAIAFQKSLEVKREAEAGDYSWFVPTAMQSGWINAGPEAKELIAERQSERWDVRGEAIGLTGDEVKHGLQYGTPVAGAIGVGIAYEAGVFTGMSCTII